jgi:hypothetical protein
MELYELIIEDENTDEVYALSLVENPAIEADWVYFTEHKEQVKFATVDNDKRTIVAPVLIPDKRIYRVDERTGHEYEVFVTAETIEKLAQQYLMKGYQNKATVEHGENIDGDVTVVESWVSKSSTKDKSANYFTKIFPAGTWFVTMRVNNEQLWQDYVKTGKVKAISIEGLFGHQLVKAASIEHIMSKDINELTEDEALLVVSKIKSLLEAQPSIPNSSYPGQAASGSIAPELLGDVPPVLQDFEAGNMNVFGIETEYFHICPGAVELFTHLVSMPMDEDTKGMVRSAALQADRIFDIEEDVLEDGKAEPKDLAQAIQLVADFKDLMGEIDNITGMKHDVSFMDGHIKVIKELL